MLVPYSIRIKKETKQLLEELKNQGMYVTHFIREAINKETKILEAIFNEKRELVPITIEKMLFGED